MQVEPVWLKGNHNFYLLMSLIAIFVLQPYALISKWSVLYFTLVTTMVFILATLAVSDGIRQILISLSLGIPAVGLDWWYSGATSWGWGTEDSRDVVQSFKLFARVLFYGYITVLMLRSILRTQGINRERLSGAIAIYLLFGMVWAQGYHLLFTIQEASFSIPARELSTDDLASLFLYYSYVTLTTVGYGDISPLSHQARTLSNCESVVGIMYVAILIARLAGGPDDGSDSGGDKGNGTESKPDQVVLSKAPPVVGGSGSSS